MLKVETEEFKIKIIPRDYYINNRVPSFDAEIECAVYHFSSSFKFFGFMAKMTLSSFDQFINDLSLVLKGQATSAVLLFGVDCKYEITLDKNKKDTPLTNLISIKEFRNIDNDSTLTCSFKSDFQHVTSLYKEFLRFKKEYDEHIKMQLN